MENNNEVKEQSMWHKVRKIFGFSDDGGAVIRNTSSKTTFKQDQDGIYKVVSKESVKISESGKKQETKHCLKHKMSTQQGEEFKAKLGCYIEDTLCEYKFGASNQLDNTLDFPQQMMGDLESNSALVAF
jgi:hypothetical protein